MRPLPNLFCEILCVVSTRTCVNQRVENISFSENAAYLMNEAQEIKFYYSRI